jgi:hypothetical protein
MTGTMWFWRHDGETGGPVTWDGLMALARSGKLRSSDPVMREGTTDWIRADQARSEGPPGLPPAPVPYMGAVPYRGAAPPMAAAMAPPPGMYGGPTACPLAAMGRPGFMPVHSAEHDYNGSGYSLSYGQGAGESHLGMAVTSFALSLIALFIFGWICGGAAVSTGLKALNGMQTSGNKSGRVFAIAGLVIGILDLCAMAYFTSTRRRYMGH